MSREEHKPSIEEILSVYRKGDEERCPNDFNEALAAVEADQELAEWFEADQLFDAEFRDALNGFEVPQQKPMVEPAPKKRIYFPLVKLAAAAVLAFVMGGLFLLQFSWGENQKSATLVSELRSGMAAFAASSFELDTMNNDLSVLRNLITSKGGTFGDALDQVFKNGTPMGCKVLDWNEHTVSLYCFGNGEGQVVHAFVVPLEAVNGKRAIAYLKAIVEHSDRDTGGFVSGNSAYLLVSSMPGVDIKPFLIPAQAEYLSACATSHPIHLALIR